MTSATLRAPAHSPAPELSSAPRLRLLPKGEDARPAAGRPPARTRFTHATDVAPADAPVLIAGRDAAIRGQLRTELTELMPAGTRFEELGALWEVLARAPVSRMVILSGELDELAPEELLHTLGHRHPDLPVVSLGASARG
jgi:hypothetical protein